MKKTLFLSCLLSAGFMANANSLLKSPVKGPLGHTSIAAMAIASDGKDVVLLLADESSLYAIDIEDDNPAEVAANAITAIPDFVYTKLMPLAGGALLMVTDIEVNPVSKSVYVLANADGNSYVFKVRNNGADVTLLDLSNTSHSTIGWGGTFSVNDMTWGDNKLFASSGSFSLNGSVATVTAPFTHSGAVTQRNTSMFKSNWGGSYYTSAPLETMTFGRVKSKSRLMGVTTCAPGFSFETSGLSGSGTLEVTEDFNLNMGVSRKMVYQQHDGKGWLFALHYNVLYRIGENFLDGSPVTTGQYNNSSLLLRTNTGDPVPTLGEGQIKRYAGTFTLISFWDEYRLVVLDEDGVLRMMQTAITAPGLSVADVQSDNNDLHVYPNPAKGVLNIELLKGQAGANLQIYTINGRLVKTIDVAGASHTIDINDLSSGQYLLKANYDGGTKAQQKMFVVQ